MSSLQISALHPETGPRQPEVGTSRTPTGGEITFNTPPSIPLINNPISVINAAIAGGDSMEKRAQQLREALNPEQE